MNEDETKMRLHPMRPAGRVAQVAPQLFHRIYNPADLSRAIRQLTGENAAGPDDLGDSDGFADPVDLSSEDRNRLRHLRRIAADPRGPQRRSIVGSPGMVHRIKDLSQIMPHLVPAIDLVARAALVSARTATPLRLPPILILGEPGIGKTFAIKRIAEAVGADFAMIPVNYTDSFRIRGLNTAWRGARMGRVAEILLEAATAPIVLLDEFEKAPSVDGVERPFDIWHSLLERENAEAFSDDFLEIAFRADHVSWIASANDVSPLPFSILDRLLILDIPKPDREQLKIIVAGLYAACRQTYGDALPECLSEEVRDELAHHNPRHVARIFDLAVGYAAADGRRHLNVDDVRRADRLAGETPADRAGFRGPIGFTRSRMPR